ncbi:beta-L-arabinofuranosidase domain-containing protein [Actinopolymorpha pittospori]|uniref:DUF1680 family protein n=1 Tax=Actinopolymorpha pittospori TaxID=648752 RepID=A0A927N0S0_9ACTN|nr:DUF1680 family protein [Actinopolymorpha pittospori]
MSDGAEVTSGLHPNALRALPLGQIRPAGWLAGQLRLQADGMAGHLDEIWPDVGESAWIGGSAEGWEGGPYWLDGVTPLAFLLEDPALLAKVERWVSYILDHQADDGWLGPRRTGTGSEPDVDPDLDVWPRMVVLKALLQYHSATGDDRSVKASLRLVRILRNVLERRPLRDWGRMRWADLVWSVHQLYDLTRERWLLEVADTVRAQGYDWSAYADHLPFPEKVPDATLREYQRQAGGVWMNDVMMATHGVNVAMGVKMPAVWWRQAGDDRLVTLVERMLDQLDTHHGQASGLFGADEHLAGRHPSQGTEACAVVELLLSLEVAVETWGAVEPLVDRLERIAYNALPATAAADERTHQYLQQANQVVCHVTQDRVYTNNGPDANIFGLAPHFGCCTANRHQGWPKFAARLWMATPDDGLQALTYAPCTIDTTVRGARTRVRVDGGYPFTDEVSIRVTVDAPVAFPLRLRVPGWAEGAELSVDGGEALPLQPGTVHELDRLWTGEQIVALRLPAPVRVEHRDRDSVAVHRGPLTFGLGVGESWQRIGGVEPYADFEVHPTTPWNYALELDPDDPQAGLALERREVGDRPYAPHGAPLLLHATGRRVPAWEVRRGAADRPPSSPVGAEDTEPGPERIVLAPYGSIRLRVTELPWTPPIA